jgi:hypothetical protein
MKNTPSADLLEEISLLHWSSLLQIAMTQFDSIINRMLNEYRQRFLNQISLSASYLSHYLHG